jgi:hypothetical protein
MLTHLDFFELRTAADLFCKIEDDLKAMEALPCDARLAFNFFVTVEHLPDWLNRRDLVQKNCVLRIVSHLANGAKHFVLNESRHKSVKSAEASRYVEAGYAEPGYFEESLDVHLSAEESSELGISVIDVVSLGRKVVQFWRPHVIESGRNGRG